MPRARRRRHRVYSTCVFPSAAETTFTKHHANRNSRSSPSASAKAAACGAHARASQDAGNGGEHVGVNREGAPLSSEGRGEISLLVVACAATSARHNAKCAANRKVNGSPTASDHAGSNAPAASASRSVSATRSSVKRAASLLSSSPRKTSEESGRPHSARAPAAGLVRNRVKKRPCLLSGGAFGGALGAAASTTGVSPPGVGPHGPYPESRWN
mmetsp:Transcript_8975/g.37698  ORF Transcript_8975/g.37698 Transcript_8975/m.37698 type:complete len:214 (+) Transcript_8975:551-1192(+)